MTRFTSIQRLCGAASLFAGVFAAADANAVSVSSPFSAGYGFTNNTDRWNDSETAGSNTIPSGNFTYSAAFTGQENSPTGVLFTSRALTAAPGQTGHGGYALPTTNAPDGFTVTLNTQFNGLPAGATNVQTSIAISQMSIWGAPFSPNDAGAAGFNELTAGHTQSQSPQTVPWNSSPANVIGYAQVVWDPSDYTTAGTSQSRKFNMTVYAGDFNLDGFEVVGNVVTTYDAPLPEPTSLGLLGLGGLAMARRRRSAR